jgi:hypothetical protein
MYVGGGQALSPHRFSFVLGTFARQDLRAFTLKSKQCFRRL